mmetsp:Transcript_42280/g.165083  ORF Transcript_42280/g.165083 Transcript_42280/m.165083 type:complete len:158 (-) Transcript_42280:200-673(-)
MLRSPIFSPEVYLIDTASTPTRPWIQSWIPELALVRLATGAPHPLLKEMQEMVEQEDALTGVGMKPLLRGDVIARRLGDPPALIVCAISLDQPRPRAQTFSFLVGGGRIVGIAIDQMIKWQLRNPGTQAKDAEEWLETFASERGIAGKLLTPVEQLY